VWEPQPKQAEALSCPADELFYGGAKGGGKALPLDEVVLTPFGERAMRDMAPGQMVCHPSGGISRVIYATEPERRMVYRLVFSDGASCRASDDHLWVVRKPGHRWKVATTEQLAPGLIVPLGAACFTRNFRYNMRPLDPYLLGLLIGDGSLGNGNIRLSTADEEIVEFLENTFGRDFVRDGGLSYRFRGEGARFLKRELERLGLRVGTPRKHIPESYLYGGLSARTELLRGLMDTDGYVDVRGHCSFSTSSARLAGDVQRLVRSLGGVGSVTVKDTVGLPSHTVYLRVPFVPFRLTRKRGRCTDQPPLRRLVSIDPVGEDWVRCIKVDAPDGLFMTRDGIVTHNSDFLLVDFCRNITYGASHKGVLFRKSYPELEELQFRALQLYPALGAEYHKTERTWIFPGGASLKLRFLENDDDVHSYQGHQYTWIGFDELTNWPTDYSYIYMFSCARSPEGVPVSIRASGNPGSVGHVWVKERFVDIAPPKTLYYDEVTQMTRCFIPAKLEDNIRLMEKDPRYEQRLKMLPPHLYRAYRDGDWDVFAGQAFSEFSRDLHVTKPFALDPSWKRFTSMDWGYSKPFSIGWWAVTGDGRFIRYREWYGCEPYKRNTGVQLPALEVAKKAWEMSVPEGCVDMVADPSCWSRQGLEGNSIADTFASAGWRMEKGNNDRKSGLVRLHDLMKTRYMDGRPMVIVFDTCIHWIRTIPTLVVDEHKPEDVDTTGEDHPYDDTRYALLSQVSRFPGSGQRRNYEVPERWTGGPRWVRPQEEKEREIIYDPLSIRY